MLGKAGNTMNRIRKMLKQDLKNIFTNEIVFLLIFLIILLPTLFVCFIINANRQPLYNKGEIKVALINKDQGGVINGIGVNMGDEVTARIKDSDGISWKIVSYEDALRGTLIGRYYGQVIIPEDFTAKIATLDTEQAELPKVQYDMNFQENIYAPTFNTINNANLGANIQKSIIRAVDSVIKEVIGDVDISSKMEDRDSDVRQVIEAILLLNKNKEQYLTLLEEYREMATKTIVLFSNIDNQIINSKIDQIQIKKFEDQIKKFLADSIQLETEYETLTGEKIKISYKRLTNTLETIMEDLEYIKEGAPALQINIKEARKIAAHFYNIVDKATNILVDIVERSNGLEAKLGFLAHKDDINKLIYNLKNEPELVAEYLESPMLLERIDKEEVFNENVTIAPFYMGIAMWIGKAILVTLLSIRFKGRLVEDEEENETEIESVTVVEEYIAKGLFFIILGMIQDFLMISIVRLLFEVGKEHQILFLLIGLLGSITFAMIVYTCASVFNNLGKLGIHLISILQLFLLGGVFPLQIIPDIFFKINRVLPFIYVVGSFRELQIDVVTINLYKSVSILILFIVYTFIFGILSKLYLKPYITKLCNVIQKSKLFIAPDE